MEKKLYDRRTIDRYLEKGILTKDEHGKYLKNLPDETNNAQWVHMDLHDAEISDEGRDEDEDDGANDTEGS